MSELKPCPFCGSSRLFVDEGEYRTDYAIICTHCGARVAYFDTYKDAVKAWDRRCEQ